ncbi:MAG TPA: IS200/IS605 family transposase [Candidatus Angelobacter sp.]|nr:IS200/IS605 family transposase [Candidatus Angelobacter sp.]
MPSSYVSSHFHIVFSTKNRERIISEQFQLKLWAYMAGIATNYGMHALAIGGMDDHIHALFSLPATMSIAKGAQVLKANSSRWVNQGRPTRFEWQEGYFACSVSRSQISRVMKYIANQREHHKKIDHADEMARLLKMHGFNPQNMPGSYVSSHFHIVFSTKSRARIISEKLQPKLWACMADIATNHGMQALAIGGMDDHLHALLSLPATMSIAKGAQLLKTNSSHWVNQGRSTRFEWQEGYFACTVSRSQISRVMKYIANQREHHKKIDHAGEMASLLKMHGFDPQS